MDDLLPGHVLAALPLYVFVLTTEGRFRYLNRAAPGRTVPRLLGRSLHEFLELGEARVFEASLSRALQGQPQTVHLDVVAVDGRLRHYMFMLSPFSERGRVTGAVGWALDVSQDGRVSDRQATTRVKQLTPRQRAVLSLVACGLSNREIGRRLGVSVRTVETHREQLSARLELRGAASLTRFALAAGLI